MLSVLILATALDDWPPLMNPLGKAQYEHTFEFYEHSSGEMLEKLRFSIVQYSEPLGNGWKYIRRSTLAEHVFGGEKLDLPKNVEPSVNTIFWSSSGVPTRADVDADRLDEFRLDRLVEFIPPFQKTKPGQTWSHTLKWPEEVAAPQIRYTYKLKELKAGVATLSIVVDEVDTHAPIHAEGLMSVSYSDKGVSIVSADLESPSAPMPGGNSTRYLVKIRWRSKTP